MRIKIYGWWILLASLLVTNTGDAGSQAGLITQVYKRESDGLLLIELSGSATGKPACATHSYWIIKDENSNTGKQQLAMLLMAKASGQAITIVGNNVCTRWSDGEDVGAVVL